ncbi:putative multidrug resistance protein fnx1 [Nemania sp. FL0916]|nr:putative multidrug resistance protein fnx1 [Nemania sp. FL0916]
MKTAKMTGKDDHKSSTTEQMNTGRSNDNEFIYLQGTRLYGTEFALVISVSLAIIVFMVNLEVTVVSPCLVSIASDFGSFDNINWVMSAYLMGTAAVIVNSAKLSDIFGRKALLILSLTLFIAFSAGCAASKSLPQLIILRSLQGLGGGGCYSLSTIIFTELVPPAAYASLVAKMSVVSSLSFVAGPLIGGAISNWTSWTWVFIVNVPTCLIALVVTLIAMPSSFPYPKDSNKEIAKSKLTKKAWRRVDVQGSMLLLLSTLAITSGFQQVGVEFAWNSAYFIILVAVGLFLFGLLLIWERHITISNGEREPVLPWRFVQNRHVIGLILALAFLGGPLSVSIYQMPQAFQIVHGLSVFDGSLRTIPFTIGLPTGTIISSVIAKQFKIPYLYVIIFASGLQVIGFALMSQLRPSIEIAPVIYFYELIAGLGCGTNVTFIFLLIPLVVEHKDRAVAIGAGSQFRIVGSAIALSVAVAIYSSYTYPALTAVLTTANIQEYDLADLTKTLKYVPKDVQIAIRLSIAKGYSYQLILLSIVSALQIPSICMVWDKTNIIV